MKKITKKQKIAALEKCAEYLVVNEEREYEDYVQYCEDYGYNPKNIRGREQQKHIYTQALIGLGLEFPEYDNV